MNTVAIQGQGRAPSRDGPTTDTQEPRGGHSTFLAHRHDRRLAQPDVVRVLIAISCGGRTVSEKLEDHSLALALEGMFGVDFEVRCNGSQCRLLSHAYRLRIFILVDLRGSRLQLASRGRVRIRGRRYQLQLGGINGSVEPTA